MYFSGSAVIGQDGRPRIFYTSIGKRDPEQWMAVPADDDLIVWEKFPANPVMTLQIHGGRRFADWRDPFVIQEGGKTYMICGGNWNGPREGRKRCRSTLRSYERRSDRLETSWPTV